MKNLPENNSMDWLGNRLRQIEQDPDEDVWARIELEVFKENIPPRKGSRYVMLLALTIIFLIPYGDNSFDQPSNTKQIEELYSYRRESIDTVKISAIQDATSTQKSFSDILPIRKTTEVRSLSKKHERKAFGNFSQSNYVPRDRSGLTRNVMLSQMKTGVLTNNFSILKLDTTRTDVDFIDSLKESASTHQTDSGKKERRFYFSITPSLSYYRITPGASDGFILRSVNSPSRLSAERLGLKAEAGIEFPLSQRITLYSGLSYFHHDYDIDFSSQSQISGVSSSVDDLSFQITRPETTHRLEYKVRHLGAQGGLLYALREGKLTQKFGLGFIYEIALKESATSAHQTTRTNGLFYQLMFRNEYLFNENINLFIQPSFSYGVLSDEDASPFFSIKPYRAGISLGAVLKITHKKNINL